MTFTDAIQVPFRSQFESSSGTLYYSQVYNCGPASITTIAQFHKDKAFGIEETRTLVVERGRPTTAYEQALMLDERGVPAEPAWIDSLQQMEDIVGWEGDRPITIGIQMVRVPASYRDHDFLGWHAITVKKRARRDGIKGWRLTDSNFSPPGGYRPDPDKGDKFYPDWVMDYAYIRNSPRMAVVSSKRKKTSEDSVIGDPVDLSFTPLTGKRAIVKANKPLRAGYRVTSARLFPLSPTRTKVPLIGYIARDKLPGTEMQYGRVLVGRKYRPVSKGYVLVHIKGVDIVQIEDV